MLRLLALLPLLAGGCSSSDPGDDVPNLPAVSGLVVNGAEIGVDEAEGRLIEALAAAGPVGVVAQINHTANAAEAEIGTNLRPTRVVLFGNPVLGTPLMQQNREVGLDLPQKIALYDGGDGYAFAAYNSAGYLAARHGLSDLPELGQIDQALARFAAAALGDSTGAQEGRIAVTAGEGIMRLQSPDDVATTFDRLRTAVDQDPAFTVAVRLNHAENAAGVGLDLPPTHLLVFGSPTLSTPLMIDEASAAIDLPQKMLVYEDDAGDVFVIYNDPAYLARRHGLDGVDEEIALITTALQSLANAAVGA